MSLLHHPELAVLPLRTPTLPPATHTNCYLLGARDLVLVDPASPWPDEQALLVRTLDALAEQGARPGRVVLTHHHHDHVGGVLALVERYGLPVYAHPRTAALLEGQITVTHTLVEGDVLATDAGDWAVLHTPGHASGHLCLYQGESGALVAGDMVASEGTIVLEPPEGDLGLYLASLERLRALGPSVIFPAHGGARRDADALLSTYIAHRHQRTDQVRAALAAAGEGAPIDLVPGVYGDSIPRFIWPLAARQVLCHLLWLVARGEVHSLSEGRFRPAEA